MLTINQLDEGNSFFLARRHAERELAPVLAEILSYPVPSSRKPGMTIDRSTILAQDKVAENRIRQFCRETGIYYNLECFPFDAFVSWMLSYSARVSPRTYRKYRKYVVDFLQGLVQFNGVEDCINQLLHGDTYDLHDDSEIEVPICKMNDDRPHILKRLPYDDFQTILRHLYYKSRSIYAHDLRNILISSMVTGLRPIEWRATRLVESFTSRYRVWLFVGNAKASNGRGNGVIRSIELTNLPPETINAISLISELGQYLQAMCEFEREFRNKFAKLMYNTVNDIWEDNSQKAYSLYSCRHQACANWKAIYGKAEAAALMGHAIIRSSEDDYAGKIHAWKPEHLTHAVIPSPHEVRKIIERQVLIDGFYNKTTDTITSRIVQYKMRI